MRKLGQRHGDVQTFVPKELSESSLPPPLGGSRNVCCRLSGCPHEADFAKKSNWERQLVLKTTCVAVVVVVVVVVLVVVVVIVVVLVLCVCCCCCCCFFRDGLGAQCV